MENISHKKNKVHLLEEGIVEVWQAEIIDIHTFNLYPLT